MVMLHDFLSENSTERSFAGYDMHDSVIEHEYYEDDGSRTKYAMSDFGVLYYKLYYTTHMYCKNSVTFQNSVQEWSEKHIKEVIDKKEISLSV